MSTISPSANDFLPGVIPDEELRQAMIGQAQEALLERAMQIKYDLHGTDVSHYQTLVIEPSLSIHLTTHPRARTWEKWLPLSESIANAGLLLPLVKIDRKDFSVSTRDGRERFEAMVEATELLASLQARVPPELLSLLRDLGAFAGHAEIAVFSMRNPEFMDVLRTNPQLATLYALHTHLGSPNSHWEQEACQDVRAGARRMVASLGLPDRPLTLKLLRRFAITELPSLDCLKKVLAMPKSGETLLNLNSCLRGPVIKLLTTIDCMLSAPILRHFMGPVPEGHPPRETALHLTVDTRTMLLRADRRLVELERIRSFSRLQRLHDELVHEVRPEERSCSLPDTTPLPCPVGGLPDCVEPLDTLGKLRGKADEFGNCARIYEPRIVDGNYYIFVITRSKQQVMVGVEVAEEGLFLDQIEAPGRRPVKESNHLWITNWLKSHSNLSQREQDFVEDFRQFV
jgi:hypothetical protein